jgi:hypothetical protein
MIFVSERDIREANAIMLQLSALWRLRYSRMHPLHHHNFICYPVESDSLRIILDITRRPNDTMEKLDGWGGVFYQETQWLEAKKEADDDPIGSVFVFAPLCAGVQWAMATTSFEHDGRQKANPAGRSDKNSRDWCVKLRKRRFAIATGHRPWERPAISQRGLFG